MEIIQKNSLKSLANNYLMNNWVEFANWVFQFHCKKRVCFSICQWVFTPKNTHLNPWLRSCKRVKNKLCVSERERERVELEVEVTQPEREVDWEKGVLLCEHRNIIIAVNQHSSAQSRSSPWRKEFDFEIAFEIAKSIHLCLSLPYFLFILCFVNGVCVYVSEWVYFQFPKKVEKKQR